MSCAPQLQTFQTEGPSTLFEQTPFRAQRISVTQSKIVLYACLQSSIEPGDAASTSFTTVQSPLRYLQFLVRKQRSIFRLNDVKLHSEVKPVPRPQRPECIWWGDMVGFEEDVSRSQSTMLCNHLSEPYGMEPQLALVLQDRSHVRVEATFNKTAPPRLFHGTNVPRYFGGSQSESALNNRRLDAARRWSL